MRESRFPCPFCAAPLKVRGGDVAGMRIDCPDCRRPLEIQENSSGTLAAAGIGAEPAPRPSALHESHLAAANDVRPEPKRRALHAAARQSAAWVRKVDLVARLKNPLVIAWTTAAHMTLVLIAAIWPRDRAAGWRAVNAENAAQAGVDDRETDRSNRSDPPKPIAAPPANSKQRASVKKQIAPHQSSPPPKPADESVAVTAPQPAEPTQLPRHVEARDVKPESVTAAEPPPPAGNPATDIPADDVSVIPVAAPHPVDIEARLSLHFSRVQHGNSVPFREFLLELEEMSGFPIRYESAQLTRPVNYLEKPVRLSLANTTLGGILDTALRQVGLAYEIEFDGIRHVPSERK